MLIKDCQIYAWLLNCDPCHLKGSGTKVRLMDTVKTIKFFLVDGNRIGIS